MKILNQYFKRPIFWDYIIVALTILITNILCRYNYINIPDNGSNLSMTSDISNIGFTSAGFVLTFLTLLITFKSSTALTKESNNESNTLFDLFLATGLYANTINHLKNAVKSLIFMAITGYMLKLFLKVDYQYLTYYFNISGIMLTSITLWRCLIILTKILQMQKD